MKIVVFGAGGIGGCFGALLARAGHEVTLVARGAHLAAMQQRGLRLRRADGEFVVDNVRATPDLQDFEGTADVVLNGVKLYDLAASAQQIRRVVGPDTMVVTTQNGVNAHEVLAEAGLPPECIVPGAVFMSARIGAPGVIELRSESTRLTFGELGGERTPRVLRFHEAGLQAGYESDLSTDMLRELWRKFVMLNAVAPLCVLSRQPVGVLREDELLRKLMVDSMHEVIAVARARGVELEPGFVDQALHLTDRRDYGAKVSLLEDLEAGRRLELEWICGYVSREARRFGIATPIADIAYACLRPAAQGTRSP
ncbi:MAG TPA: 2-dehydropantoate 2-reductase [Ramlibacter sp.]|jgi:2-dehydropantoate 2-reductase|nr:2-dehydropantoate 2-reductase [Ramlibacter sp.]